MTDSSLPSQGHAGPGDTFQNTAVVRVTVVGNNDLSSVDWSVTPGDALVFSQPQAGLPPGNNDQPREVVFFLDSASHQVLNLDGNPLVGVPITGLQIQEARFYHLDAEGNKDLTQPVTLATNERGTLHIGRRGTFHCQDCWIVQLDPSLGASQVDKLAYELTIRNGAGQEIVIDPEVDIGPPGATE